MNTHSNQFAGLVNAEAQPTPGEQTISEDDSRPFAFLRDLPIGRKFLVILLLIIIGFCGLGLAYTAAQTLRGESDRVLSEFEHLDKLHDQISIGVLQARRREKDFLLRNDPKYLEQHAQIMASIDAGLTDLRDEAPNEEVRAFTEQIDSLIVQYTASFSEMAEARVDLGLDENSGLLGELRSAVHKAEKALQEHQTPELLNSMLMMRRHEKDYLARKHPKYIERMDGEQQRFAELLQVSAIVAEYRGEIAAFMAKYHAAFKGIPDGFARIDADTAEFRKAAHDVDPLLETLREALDQLVADKNAETAAAQRAINWGFLATLLVIGGLVCAGLHLMSRLIRLPLLEASKVAAAIAEGELENNIVISGRDETGSLLVALLNMQQKLKARIESDRELSEETDRVKQALDCVGSAVLLADDALRVIYANDAATKMFSDGQSDIRQDLVGFDGGQLVGMRLDSLHTNPLQQQGLLSGLAGSSTSRIELGGRHYDARFSAVTDGNGQRTGVVAEWEDRTLEINVECEIQGMVDSALRGDLTARVSVTESEGFVATLAGGINELVDIAEQVVKDTQLVFTALVRGDLSVNIERDYAGSFGQLKSDANTSMQKLDEVMKNIREAVVSVRTGAREIAHGNNDLSQRTEQQASNLEETSSSMEEMTSTVKANADHAFEANKLALTAREKAESGGEVVRSAVVAMQEINASSNKIVEIISVIDEIAFQTNLLALNASVEAARAGEQGRGFAVVASEVRNLAGRSATAAREIKQLIEDSAKKVNHGSALVNQSGENLEAIVQGVRQVHDIVGEIASASQEQSAGIEEVNKAILQMDQLTQHNAALVEEVSAAAQSMDHQAGSLRDMVNFFNGESALTEMHPKTARDQADGQVLSLMPVDPVVANTGDQTLLAATSVGGSEVWQEF